MRINAGQLMPLTLTQLSLAPVNPDWFLLLWYWLTRVVPDTVQGP